MEKKISEKAIADSGFLYALINRKDPNHERAKKGIAKCNKKWITTCFVFHEVFFLLHKRHYHLIPNLFQMEKTKLLEILAFECSQLIDIEIIVSKYADRKLDIADASLIFLAGILGHGDIFTVDTKDFSSCCWNNKNPFNILL
jgi:predicted nucleic acid-binding protein